jgi:hypothetical protein
MARIQNPLLFSQHFGIDPIKLKSAGLLDPFLDVDTQLFIDPVLLSHSSNELISVNAMQAFQTHFNNYIRLLSISKREGDAAWKGAQRLLDLGEPPENGLGYGGSGRSGSSRPDRIRDSMMKTSKEIIELGSNDPEMVSLMGFFEEEVGADTISDFTTRVIINELSKITQDFCIENNIEIKEVANNPQIQLPHFLDSNGRSSSIVLVPIDILRDLPIANDWSDISEAVMLNFNIRDGVNELLGSIAKPTIADRKQALKHFALSSSGSFDEVVKSLWPWIYSISIRTFLI